MEKSIEMQVLSRDSRPRSQNQSEGRRPMSYGQGLMNCLMALQRFFSMVVLSQSSHTPERRNANTKSKERVSKPNKAVSCVTLFRPNMKECSQIIERSVVVELFLMRRMGSDLLDELFFFLEKKLVNPPSITLIGAPKGQRLSFEMTGEKLSVFCSLFDRHPALKMICFVDLVYNVKKLNRQLARLKLSAAIDWDQKEVVGGVRLIRQSHEAEPIRTGKSLLSLGS